jgi:hypothetical protein
MQQSGVCYLWPKGGPIPLIDNRPAPMCVGYLLRCQEHTGGPHSSAIAAFHPSSPPTSPDSLISCVRVRACVCVCVCRVTNWLPLCKRYGKGMWGGMGGRTEHCQSNFSHSFEHPPAVVIVSNASHTLCTSANCSDLHVEGAGNMRTCRSRIGVSSVSCDMARMSQIASHHSHFTRTQVPDILHVPAYRINHLRAACT